MATQESETKKREGFPLARVEVQLSEGFRKRLSAYALGAGAAGVGLLAMTQPAQADIVFDPGSSAFTNVGFDLDHDGVAEFGFFQYGFSIGYPCACAGQSNRFGIRGFGNNLVLVGPLKQGAVIGPHGSFYNSRTLVKSTHVSRFLYSAGGLRTMTIRSSRVYGPWANVKDGYMGLRFDINGEPHFGWVRFQSGFSLNGAAYNTVPGQAILAGEVPEPGTLGLLALGSLGLGFWRRKQESEARSGKSE